RWPPPRPGGCCRGSGRRRCWRWRCAAARQRRAWAARAASTPGGHRRCGPSRHTTERCAVASPDLVADGVAGLGVEEVHALSIHHDLDLVAGPDPLALAARELLGP